MRDLLRRSWPVLLVAAVAAGAYLCAGWATMPMDDAYIHFVYARNLATHGALTFNLDPPDPGVGTTSILWPLLLAALYPVIGIVNAARVLGLAAWLAFAAGVVVIAGWLVPGERSWPRWVAAPVALSGNLIWFALSGMETMLFMALGVWALLAWHHRRYVALGIILGLLLLTRIEGVVLLVCLVVAELVRDRRLGRPALVTGLLAALLVSPWLGYLHARTGHFLPTSYSGKKHAQLRAAVEVVNKTVGAAGPTTQLETSRLPWWVPLLYPAAAAGYGLAFVVGGAYLPGPQVPLPGQLGATLGGLAVLGLVLFVGLYLPCFWAALRRLPGVFRRARAEPRCLALAVLAAWFVLHNVAYWLKLPTPGTASRYQVVNHVAFWLLAAAGAWRLGRSDRARLLWLSGVLAAGLWNACWWRGVFASDVRHMRQVRLAAADYVCTQLPADAVVAAHDIGALGWRMERRCLDLGGLIDPAFLVYARDGRVAEFLKERGATHLVLPTKHSTETTGFYDYAAFVGLKDNPKVRYIEVAHFENDYADWQRGAESTWNALPGVTVYRFDWSAR